MRYKEIKQETNNRAPSSTIKGLKKLLQKGKNLGEIFKCLCPNGNIHIWEIKQDRTHVCVGSSPRKKAARVGKGINKHHFQAKLKQVQYV
jgi:hypothetical protein